MPIGPKGGPVSGLSVQNYIQRVVGLAFGAAIAGAVVLVTGGSVAAQQVAQSDDQSREVEERFDQLRQEREASGRPRLDFFDLICPSVSYADVLENPDDVDVNVCYALGRVKEGNLRSAAATLERILLLKPRAHDVRMLYAVVLYRLDSIDEAEREFLLVREATDLPPEIDAKISDFLARIERRRQTLKQTVTASLGLHYDTNRNFSPRSEQVLAGGSRADLANEEDRREEDFGVIASGSYDFTYDPGYERGHEFIGGVDIFTDTQTQRNELDAQAINLELGVRLRYPGLTITPKAFLTNMRLGWDKFYQSEGASIRFDHKHDVVGVDWPELDTWYEASIQHEDYHNTREFQSLTLRNGNRYNQEIGFGMQVHPDHYVQLIGGWEYKSAAPDHANNAGAAVFSYREHSGQLNHTWILEDNRFLLSSLEIARRTYRASDSLVTGSTTGIRRQETPIRLRVTYGMPLTDILGSDWLDPSVSANAKILEIAEESILSVTGEYTRQEANITNFVYENSRIQLTLTRRFDF